MSAASNERAAESLTLSDLLPSALASPEAWRGAVARAVPAIPQAALAASETQWLRAVSTILTIPVGQMFKAACLKIALETPTLRFKDGEGSLALAPFVVESSHHPTVVASWGAATATLKFDLELSLSFEAVKLHARQGRLVRASTGSGKGTTSIRIMSIDPPIELGSPTFEFPGEVRFDDPPPAPGP